ncbi:MAG: hypothetical protein ACPG05_03035 [Bdellovibrionales bacterium]
MVKEKQNGNVLFLILIAVVLFAALSYAVTQSTRGGGDTDSENVAIMASQATQYASRVKTAAMRMMLIGGTDLTTINFTDVPNGRAGLQFDRCTSGVNCVFADEGGGIEYIPLPPIDLTNRDWQVAESIALVSVSGVGTAAPDDILYAQEISLEACEAFNKGLGLPATPVQNTTELAIPGPDTIDAYPGEEFGCIENGAPSTGTYWYYHVLVAR